MKLDGFLNSENTPRVFIDNDTDLKFLSFAIPFNSISVQIIFMILLLLTIMLWMIEIKKEDCVPLKEL